MATIHWQPFEQMDALRHQIDEVFGDLARTAVEPQDTGWWPRVELVDTPEYFRLRVQLPGVERDGLDIQATLDTVSIAGERPYPEKRDHETYLHSDFAYGKFGRTIKLPVEISPDTIQASLQDGLLMLILPKADHTRRRTVKVQVNGLNGNSEQKALDATSKDI